jgi:hypothetical protein
MFVHIRHANLYAHARHVSHLHYARSTPAERARTVALNVRQAREQGRTRSGETGLAAAADNQSARRQYAEQLEFYRVQRGQYEDELDRYRYHMARYEYDRAHPSAWWRVRYDGADADALIRVPPPDLIGHEIEDRNGVLLGRIYSIERTPDGNIARIQVAIGYDRAAWIHPDELRYDAADSIVFADMGADDLYDRSRRVDADRRG